MSGPSPEPAATTKDTGSVACNRVWLDPTSALSSRCPLLSSLAYRGDGLVRIGPTPKAHARPVTNPGACVGKLGKNLRMDMVSR